MPETARLRAAEYVRMSTDMQGHSIGHQREAIANYAAERGIEIVRSFADEAKSGVTLQGREALKALLNEVLTGSPDFELLLVYDVSRWGRFQDVDEAAHYEFLCRSRGVRVIYCAEQFGDEPSPMAAVLKSLKRAMAGEYSRELSNKVSQAKRRLAALGHFPGGPAGYGLRRLVLDEAGRPLAVLSYGQRKAVHSHRVVFTLGPADEVANVRRMFDLYIDERMSLSAIARLLNDEGLRSEAGRPWSKHTVGQILSNEKYAGNIVCCRRIKRLGAPHVRAPPESWVRCDGAFEGIVSQERFQQARGIAASKIRTDGRLLRDLRALLAKEGRLSSDLIVKAGISRPYVYAYRFGSLSAAYRLIGYELPDRTLRSIAARAKRNEDAARLDPPRWGRSAMAPAALARRVGERRRAIEVHHVTDEELLTKLTQLRMAAGRLSTSIIDAAPGLPSAGCYRRRFGSLLNAYAAIGYQFPEWRAMGAQSRWGPPLQPGGSQLETGASPSHIEKFRHHWRFTDAELDACLLAGLQRHGTLSCRIIAKDQRMPSTTVYYERFGSMKAAYARIGFIEPPACGPRPRERPLGSSANGPDELSGGGEDGSAANEKPVVQNDHGHTSA